MQYLILPVPGHYWHDRMTYTELSSESEGPFVLVHQEGLRQYRLEICRIARKRGDYSWLMMPVRTYLSSSQA